MLEEKIQNDLSLAIKERNENKINALRSIKSAILNEKTSGKYHELSDSDIITIIQKLSKQRSESAEIYNSNGRPELAGKELSEKKHIDEYLPKMMTETELTETIDSIVREFNITSMKQMGIVMKNLKERFSGQYDGACASSIIKSKLQ